MQLRSDGGDEGEVPGGENDVVLEYCVSLLGREEKGGRGVGVWFGLVCVYVMTTATLKIKNIIK